MTFEEMQRAMEFVVQHQAQAEVNMARLEGNLTKLEGNVTRLEGNVTRLETSLKAEHEQRTHRDRQIAQWISRVRELIVLQSSRIDSAHEQHLQSLARLDRILEILAHRK